MMKIAALLRAGEAVFASAEARGWFVDEELDALGAIGLERVGLHVLWCYPDDARYGRLLYDAARAMAAGRDEGER
jgi:hypothetical protein